MRAEEHAEIVVALKVRIAEVRVERVERAERAVRAEERAEVQVELERTVRAEERVVRVEERKYAPPPSACGSCPCFHQRRRRPPDAQRTSSRSGITLMRGSSQSMPSQPPRAEVVWDPKETASKV